MLLINQVKTLNVSINGTIVDHILNCNHFNKSFKQTKNLPDHLAN